MTKQELQEIYELLKKSRLNPQWCDTCVPYYENGVKAGVPSDPDDHHYSYFGANGITSE